MDKTIRVPHQESASGPFYGFNRPGAKVSEGIIQNWWRQGMMGGIKAHYEIVPYADAGVHSAKLLKNATLKIYKGFPHGMCTTQADTINADLLAFIRS
jgi:non-heme chloroperoxidase